jgi:hypothetical protein
MFICLSTALVALGTGAGAGSIIGISQAIRMSSGVGRRVEREIEREMRKVTGNGHEIDTSARALILNQPTRESTVADSSSRALVVYGPVAPSLPAEREIVFIFYRPLAPASHSVGAVNRPTLISPAFQGESSRVVYRPSPLSLCSKAHEDRSCDYTKVEQLEMRFASSTSSPIMLQKKEALPLSLTQWEPSWALSEGYTSLSVSGGLADGRGDTNPPASDGSWGETAARWLGKVKGAVLSVWGFIKRVTGQEARDLYASGNYYEDRMDMYATLESLLYHSDLHSTATSAS